MKQIKCSDYVIERNKNISPKTITEIFKYANFLKRPLELGMFIPCDLEGNVLVEPLHVFSDHHIKEKSKQYQNWELTKQFKEAKERVLFEFVDIADLENGSYSIMIEGRQIGYYKSRPDYFVWNYKTIEDLTELGLTLTDNAVKQLN